MEREFNQVGDVIAVNVKDGHWRTANEVTIQAKGEWLVTEAYMGGGDSLDGYPDGWIIKLIKLGKDRTVPKERRVKYSKPGLRLQVAGRTIKMYQSGCFNNKIPYVEPVARLKKVISWEN